jgi:hypothetical protein
MPAPDAPAEERAAWDDAMAAHRRAFERMDLLRQQMLGLDWTYGQVCPDGIASAGCLLADVSADSDGAAVLGDLALSLMAVGRLVEARPTVESAVEIAAPGRVAEAAAVLRLLLEDLPELEDQLPDALAEAREAAVAGACGDAVEAVRSATGDGGEASPEERLVAAYVVARCGPDDPTAMATVATTLAPIADDADLGARYPALLYLLARSAVVRGLYAEATSRMLAHVRAAAARRASEAPSAPGDE